MIRKAILALTVLFTAVVITSAQTRITPSDLTLDEKIHLLSVDMGIERLGVPQSFYAEGMHGLGYGGPSNWGAYKPLNTTIFPQAYGLAQTWDPELLEKVGEQISTEQRYYFQNPKYDRGGLILWGPNVDPGRDPRWGRVEESYGEDPWLVSQMAMGYIRGAMGPDTEHWRVSPVMKHFMGNSYEDGRHVVSSDFDERQMREYYSYTFWKCVTEAGCRGFMTSYNMVNGVPMTANPLTREMAVEEWGMDGVICSDEDAMGLLIKDYNVCKDYAEAVALCLKNGTTQFLDSKDDSQSAIREALRRGLITEADIDEAIQRNLNVEQKLGFLGGDDPYAQIGRDGGELPYLFEDAKALCREVTAKSVVLMKNDGILPLDPAKLKKVAVIGPNADVVFQDWYCGNSAYAVSILDGIKAALGDNVEVVFEKYDIGGLGVKAAREADVAIVVVGNRPSPCLDFERKNPELGWGKSYVISDGMEQVDRQSMTLAQEDILKLIYRANKNTVMVLTTTFPYTIGWSKDNVPAILQTVHASQEMGNGVADVLFGKVNPAGRLTQTWPKSILDIPAIDEFDITKGRTYMYAKAKPLFAFGHGLSYSKFKYSALRVSKPVDGVMNVTVKIKNVSAVDGEEVVQLYVKYPRSKVLRPERQLRGFKRIAVPAGQSVEVTIPLAVKDLAYWDIDRHEWVVEKCRVRFLVGAASDDIRVRAIRRIR